MLFLYLMRKDVNETRRAKSHSTRRNHISEKWKQNNNETIIIINEYSLRLNNLNLLATA